MNEEQEGLGRGYFQVYTGNGKGKTTASLGLAFRAAGHGMKTYIGQFMKGQLYGELKACRLMEPLITIEQYGKNTFTHAGTVPRDDDIEMAKHGLLLARESMLSGLYDIVIFDEINTAHWYRLITTTEMIETIDMKPAHVEVVFTGRYAPSEIIAIADLVTESREVKHYYQQGVKARKGIEL